MAGSPSGKTHYLHGNRLLELVIVAHHAVHDAHSGAADAARQTVRPDTEALRSRARPKAPGVGPMASTTPPEAGWRRPLESPPPGGRQPLRTLQRTSEKIIDRIRHHFPFSDQGNGFASNRVLRRPRCRQKEKVRVTRQDYSRLERPRVSIQSELARARAAARQSRGNDRRRQAGGCWGRNAHYYRVYTLHGLLLIRLPVTSNLPDLTQGYP
jgi:hypothetical protein